MKNIHVLLAGESWVSNSTHFKGWDFFQIQSTKSVYPSLHPRLPKLELI